MTKQQKTSKPVYWCDAAIEGPKVGKHVVLWRKYCRNRVKEPGDRCRFHPRVPSGGNSTDSE